MKNTPNYKTISISVFESESTPAPAVVNVWVHGTSQNPLIRKIHASPNGITPLSELESDWGLNRMGHALAEHDAAQFPARGFYTFGWSGKLSLKARRVAGAQLNAALRLIIENHKMDYNVTPRIRVIAHSHGCNVALNASEHLNRPENPILIDELVLLACPVQQATAHLITAPTFKDVYALYSTRDYLQVIDPQGLNRESVQTGGRLFSERRFLAQPNLTQAQIRWRGAGLSHVGFIRQRFGKALPSILAHLRKEKADCVISII